MQQITKNTDENLSLKPKSRPKPFAPTYVIESLFPDNEVHLVAGPSGSGKTSWLFQTIQRWKDGLPVLGKFKSHAKPFVYVACDRSSKNLYTTQERCQVDFPVLSLPEVPFDNPSSTTYRKLIPKLIKDNPEARVFFIDGLATIVQESTSLNDYNSISKFLTYLLKECLQNDITIFGIVHSNKIKEEERYLNPRERILGSVAWAAFSETVTIIEQKEKSKNRLVSVFPRNTQELILEYEMTSNGFMMPVQDLTAPYIIEPFLSAHAGKQFSREELESYVRGKNVSLETLEEGLRNALEKGAILQVRPNSYVCSKTPGCPELLN